MRAGKEKGSHKSKPYACSREARMSNGFGLRDRDICHPSVTIYPLKKKNSIM
jgi:hypothetical protein